MWYDQQTGSFGGSREELASRWVRVLLDEGCLKGVEVGPAFMDGKNMNMK